LIVLAGGLAISVIVGSTLGRAYQAREEAAPAQPGPDDARVLAEALELDSEPAPPRPIPEADAARRAQLAEALTAKKVERTGQAALRQRMPLPPKAGQLVSIGDQLDAHGVPMNLAAFETKMSTLEVLQYYAEHFEKQGWPYSNVPSARGLVPFPRVSATLMDEELQITVMVMPHDDGNTVVLGLADMKAFREGKSHEDTGDLPVYPGTHPVAITARDEGSASLTVSFDTGDAPSVVENFYRKELAQRGYAEVADAREPDTSGTGPRTLRFASRQGRAWNLALSTVEGGTAVTAHSSLKPEATP
jgi:hypothetical protein